MFGTLADFDELLAGVHERGMKLVMDLVVNHTSDEHPWFVESPLDRDNPKRDWYWWRPPRRDGAGDPAPSRPTGRRSSPARPGSSTRPAASTTCTCSRRKQPDLNWENPRGPAGRLRDDALVARPRGRRLPDGRHQHDLQGRGAARRRAVARAAPRRRRAVLHLRPAHPRVPAGDAPRGVRRPRRPAAHRRRDAGRHRRAGARCSPTPPAREVDMVFQFEHVSLDQGGEQVGRPPAAAPRPQGVARPLAGRPGRDRLEQPLLEQPRPAAGRLPVRRRRRATACASAKLLGDGPAPAPRHAVRLPGRGARHDERALRRASRSSATSSRSTTTPPRWPRAATRGRARRAARDGPRQRAHARCSGTPRRTPASPAPTPWIPVNPNHAEINAAAARPTRTPCSTTTAG